jgi:predicted AAA+ superfamily ATPase
MVRGGFPLSLRAQSGLQRSQWFDSYLGLTLERDLRELSNVRHGWALPELLSRVTAHTGSELAAFGHLLESFAVGELTKEASWSENMRVAGYWRTYDGDEVDLIVEHRDGRVIAFEIKVGSIPRPEDYRGLRKLKTKLGNRMVAGILLHTGVGAASNGDGIYTIPIDRLWKEKP